MATGPGNRVPRPCSFSVAPSADDKFGHPPHLFALLKPNGNSTGAHVVHHYGAGFIDAVRDLADPDRPDCGVSMEPGQGRVTGTGELAPNKGGAVLQCGQATGVNAPGELMDWPDACEHLHGRLHCVAGYRADFRHIVGGTQRRGSSLADRRQGRGGCPAR
jgi:hypothetical protein